MSAFRKLSYWGQSKPPHSPTVVNWGHPLSSQLQGAFLFNENAGLKALSSAKPKYNATRASLAAYGQAPNGRSGIALNAAATTTLAVTPANAFTTGTTFTIALRIKVRTSAAATYSALFGDALGSSGFYINAQVMNYVFSSTDHLANTALTLGVWYDIALSVAAGAGTFYVNGVADGTVASVITQTLATIGSDASGDTLDAVVDYFYFWTRALKQSEIRQLRATPFDIFSPSTKRRARPAVAAAGGFKPYWASRRSRVIGAGVI